jgi:hypothetical protein
VQENDDPSTMTDDRARELMYQLGEDHEGFTMNSMKGTVGDFYRENRAEDIHTLCLEILADRASE